MLHLRAFGGGGLRASDGREIESVLAQPKRFALLVYLAAAAPRDATSRDVLLSTFWPDLDSAHGRQSLNKALHFLRRALGAGTIVSRGEGAVAVDLSVLQLDTNLFDEARDARDFERAAALYRGDFLDGFFVSDASPELDEWIAGERRRLRHGANAVMWWLADRALETAAPDAARDWARRAVALAPDDERGMRRLVALLEQMGDRAGAAQTYDAFASRLRRDFDVAPSAESQALWDTLRAPPVAARHVATEVAASSPLISPSSIPVSGLPARTESTSRGRGARMVSMVIALAGLLAVLAFAIDRSRLTSSAPLRVAVATFRNATGDSAFDMLGPMAADWTTEGLQRSGLVKVVPSVTVLLSTSRPPASAGATPAVETAREMRRATGANLTVVGSYYFLNENIHYEVQLVDPVDGMLRGSAVSVSVRRDDVMQGLELVRERVAGNLATVLDPRLVSSVAVSSVPPTLGAYEEYVTGLDALYRRKDRREAVARFERAAARDSSYIAPLLTLVDLYFSTGTHRAQADSVARIIERSRSRLSGFERLELDRWQAVLRDDLEAAYAASTKIAVLAPRSHFIRMLALDASATMRLHEAVEALKQLDPDWGWVRGWQDYWATLAYGLHDLGEYDRELVVARRARAVRPDYLRFRWLEIQALVALGRIDEVRARLAETLTLPYSAAGVERDLWTPGDLMRNVGLELRAHGEGQFGHEVLERAHGWFAASPLSERDVIVQQYNRLQRLEELERWSEAVVVADSLLGSTAFWRDAHAAHGMAAAVAGDSVRANAEMSFLSATAPGGVTAGGLYASAKIAALLGERGRALNLLERSYSRGQRHVFWDHLIAPFESLRNDERYRMLMRPKDLPRARIH